MIPSTLSGLVLPGAPVGMPASWIDRPKPAWLLFDIAVAEKRKPLRILGAFAAGLFILCLPLFLLTSNLRWAVNETRLYQYGFNKYEVSEETGIGEGELLGVAQGLIDYFNSGEEPIQITVLTEEGEELDPFTEREVLHLKDVKGLIGLCYHLQEATFGCLAAVAIAGFIWQRRRFWPRLAKLAVGGSALTIALLILLGIGALVNFEGLFLGFHRLFFSGNSWVFSPEDYLVRLFPQGFFYHATLFIAGAIAVEALVIGGIGSGFLVLRRRRGQALP